MTLGIEQVLFLKSFENYYYYYVNFVGGGGPYSFNWRNRWAELYSVAADEFCKLTKGWPVEGYGRNLLLTHTIWQVICICIRYVFVWIIKIYLKLGNILGYGIF